MNVVFIHNNYPAQFGHLGHRLIQDHGGKVTFVSERPPQYDNGIEVLQYSVHGAARKTTHKCSRSFENATWKAAGIYDALQDRSDIQPDVVVTHSGYFHSVFLRELYDCPIISYFEYFYRTVGGDMDFRTDLPGAKDRVSLRNRRARARNASFLLDLDNCDAGYSPIRWQHRRLVHRQHIGKQ